MECVTITILFRVVGKGTFVKVTLEKELNKFQEQTRQRRLGEGRST